MAAWCASHPPLRHISRAGGKGYPRRERPRRSKTPVHAGSAFNFSPSKQERMSGEIGKAVRQMCTAEILSDPCRSWVDSVDKVPGERVEALY
jgi:hypothetical protein